MKYSCKYKTNPSFPYQKDSSSKKISPPKKPYKASYWESFFAPVEKIIGRKIEFDDILLIGIIYIIFTEKNKEKRMKRIDN